MASTYSSNIRLELMASGENDATWGTKTNTNLQLLEAAIAGRSAVTHDDTANYTLTTANGSADEARRMILNIGGALSAARNVVCPTQAKFYVVKNATTGGYAVTLKTSAGTGIAVPNGKTMMLFCDGTNVVESIDQVVGNFAVGGTLSVTGATTLSAALTYGGVALSNAVTGTGNMVLSTSPTLVTPLLGTPTSGVLTNCTGLPIAGTTGYGTGVATALAVNVGSAGAFLTFNGDAGTPSALVGTNISGTAASLTAGVASAVAASGITGTTLAAGVVTSSLTTVGALNAGSITNGFGSIDVGADAISGGAITGTATIKSNTGIHSSAYTSGTVVNDGTYAIVHPASATVLAVIRESGVTGGYGIFVGSDIGSLTKIASSTTTYSWTTTQDNAGTINVYWSGGLVIQNKTGVSLNFQINIIASSG